jgi:hypothetical protein
MLETLEQNLLSAECLRERSQLLRECSIRRAAKVLAAKRERIREELEQVISHIALLVPLTDMANGSAEAYAQLLQDAAAQLGDEAFTQLLLQVLQEIQRF